ncbi:hypothetical protein Hanom_Chr02g00095941 [Helianthus anomalus]
MQQPCLQQNKQCYSLADVCDDSFIHTCLPQPYRKHLYIFFCPRQHYKSLIFSFHNF